MLDQSSGHCKVREDGLVVSKMNVNYGGKASNMRDTTIHEVGEFGAQLTVGDRQSMNFSESDRGPFWMDDAECASSKYNIEKNTNSVRQKTKIELLQDLQKKE